MITGDEAGFAAFVAARSAALSRTAYLLTGDHSWARGQKSSGSVPPSVGRGVLTDLCPRVYASQP